MQKRIRKRIIIGLSFLILVIILFVNLPAFLEITRLDHQIKNYIVQKMITSNAIVLNVEDISIGFRRITLENVDFISRARQITTVVKGIEFEYNIFILFFNPDKPYKAINEIYFTEPQLVLQEQESDIDSLETDARLSSILETLRQINFPRVMVEKGRISFKYMDGEYLSLVSDLQGWIESDVSSNLHIALSGKLARSYKENFKLNCDVFPKEKAVQGEVSFIDYQLNLLNDLHDQSIFSISEGMLNSKLTFKLNQFSLDALKIYGSVSVEGVEAKIVENHLSMFSCNASFFDKTMLMENAGGILDGSPFDINAEIVNLFQPVIEGEFLFPELNLSSFERYMKTGTFDESKVRVDGDFKLSKDDFVIDMVMSSPEFSYNKQIINDFIADVSIRQDGIIVNSVVLNYFGFSLHSEGSINLNDGDYICSLYGSRQFDQHLFFDKISFAEQVGSLDLRGNVKDETLKGNWTYYIDDFYDTLLYVQGNISLRDDNFTFTTDDVAEEDWFFSLQISDVLESTGMSFGYLKNPPLKELTSRKWIHELLSTYEIESILTGNFNTINTEFRMNHKQIPNRNMIIAATINDLLLHEKKIRSKINVMHLEAEADLLFGKDYVTGRLMSGDFLRGNIDINLHREQQMQSKITIDRLNLSHLIDKDLFGKEGEINGEITISGLLDAPEIKATLTGDKLMLNDVGYYKVGMDLTMENNCIYAEPIKVLLNNSPVLDGTFGLHLKKQQLSITANGEKIAADYFFKTLTGKQDFLSGHVDYNLIVNGPLSAPKSELNLRLENGKLAQIPFEHIELAVIDSILEDSSFFALKNHVITLNNFKMINSGQYHLEGSGTIPLIMNGPLDFGFHFDGDIFSFFPQWHSFFVDGVSFTSIEGTIRGTPRSPRIARWQADIERGELWLKSVAKHIENINGRIALEEGTNRINFTDLYGEINGKRASFQTVRDITTSSGKKLEHWYFENIDLDFGILAINTQDEGVALHIPGLMQKNETGIIDLSGRVPDESFYFAGPVKHPCAWGKAIISDSRITFPFITTGGNSKPSKTVEFLMNVDWDVFAQAGKDLEYVRDIPALIGYVDTEVSIDPFSEGLYFGGILAENEFGIEGKVYSSRGRLDYLDMNFRVENFGIEFNKLEIEPEVYGRAWTTVRDSADAVPRTIYLELYAYDEQTDQENRRARWEDFKFRLSSADIAIGETQDEVLAYLGYTESNIQDKAKDVGGAVTDNYLIRPLLRPVERSLERFFGMDMVRFNSALTKNLFYSGFRQKTDQVNLPDQSSSFPYLYLMESSEVTLGKYLSRDLYVTYTGQLVLNSIQQENELNFNHSVGLEYRFLNNLLIELEYDREFFNYYKIYSNKLYQDDFRIRLRHSFTF